MLGQTFLFTNPWFSDYERKNSWNKTIWIINTNNPLSFPIQWCIINTNSFQTWILCEARAIFLFMLPDYNIIMYHNCLCKNLLGKMREEVWNTEPNLLPAKKYVWGKIFHLYLKKYTQTKRHIQSGMETWERVMVENGWPKPLPG